MSLIYYNFLGAQEFKCSQCYRLKMSLSNHKRVIHGNPKLYPCTCCEYTAKSKQFIKSIHEKIKETCEVFGKQFSNSPNLNTHKKNYLNSSSIEKMK